MARSGSGLGLGFLAALAAARVPSRARRTFRMEHPELSPGIDAVVSFGEDARGELLVVDFGDIPGTPGLGEVWRVTPGS